MNTATSESNEIARIVPEVESEIAEASLDVATGSTLYPPRVVSGIQPTAAVHLGQYFGALKYHIELHNQYPGQSFFLIADYHALTRATDPERVRMGTIELATTYLALGLDPHKATLYRQSDVPQVTELAWIFSCLTSVAELTHMPSYKASIETQTHKTLGLLSYPVLMAADILALRGTVIPVGRDQEPHVDKARQIARRFNTAYACTLFPIPTTVQNASHTVVGIDGRKMSNNYKNTIGLFEPFDILQEKVFKIVTDSKGQYEPKNPNACRVFQMFSLVAPPKKLTDMSHKYGLGAIGYEDAKRELVHWIQSYFSSYLENYRKLKSDPDFVSDVLREGFMQASEEADETLDEVRALVGLAAT